MRRASAAPARAVRRVPAKVAPKPSAEALEALEADLDCYIMSAASDAQLAREHGLPVEAVHAAREGRAAPWTGGLEALARRYADAIEWEGGLVELVEAVLLDRIAEVGR